MNFRKSCSRVYRELRFHFQRLYIRTTNFRSSRHVRRTRWSTYSYLSLFLSQSNICRTCSRESPATTTGTASGTTHFTWESSVASSHCFSPLSSFAPYIGCSGKSARGVRSSSVLRAQGRNSFPIFYSLIGVSIAFTHPSYLPTFYIP